MSTEKGTTNPVSFLIQAKSVLNEANISIERRRECLSAFLQFLTSSSDSLSIPVPTDEHPTWTTVFSLISNYFAQTEGKEHSDEDALTDEQIQKSLEELTLPKPVSTDSSGSLPIARGALSPTRSPPQKSRGPFSLSPPLRTQLETTPKLIRRQASEAADGLEEEDGDDEEDQEEATGELIVRKVTKAERDIILTRRESSPCRSPRPSAKTDRADTPRPKPKPTPIADFIIETVSELKA
jgi:hypothetical protein